MLLWPPKPIPLLLAFLSSSPFSLIFLLSPPPSLFVLSLFLLSFFPDPPSFFLVLSTLFSFFSTLSTFLLCVCVRVCVHPVCMCVHIWQFHVCRPTITSSIQNQPALVPPLIVLTSDLSRWSLLKGQKKVLKTMVWGQITSDHNWLVVLFRPGRS